MAWKGKPQKKYIDLSEGLIQAKILHYYIGVDKVPCIISSPFRIDNHPSFRIFTLDGVNIAYKDFSTGESGTILDLLSKLFNKPYNDTVDILEKELPKIKESKDIQFRYGTEGKFSVRKSDDSLKVEVKVRRWMKHDLEYWKEFGISLDYLKMAEVYPISHKIITIDDKRYVFPAEKYAYVYVERKENHITLKIYQPFSKKYKWTSQNDNSVVSLWTKIPEKGNQLAICSSVKDALCLWENTGIPALALGAEGYGLSKTALNVLKSRYDDIFIILDNDKAGIEYSKKLSTKTGLRNVILPTFIWGKDISDYYKGLENKSEFKETMLSLINKRN